MHRTSVQIDIHINLQFSFFFFQSFHLYYVERLNRSKTCHAPRDYRIAYFAWRYIFFSFFIRFFAPVLMIIVCNMLIIQRISQATAATDGNKQHLQQAPSSNKSQTSKTSREKTSRDKTSREKTSRDKSSRDSDNLLEGRGRNSHQSVEVVRRRPTTIQRRHKAVQSVTLAIYTLFAVCALFILTLLPNAIISLIVFIDRISGKGNKQLYCVLKQIDAPFQMIRLSNYALNIVLYGLTGRQFRYELKQLLKLWTACGCFTKLRVPSCRSFWRKSTRQETYKVDMQTFRLHSRIIDIK